MSEFTPTRSTAMLLQDERRTLSEGARFLDEKCLLLAGEMLRALREVQLRRRDYRQRAAEASAALTAALARHGLHGLQALPAAAGATPVQITQRAILGVALVDAACAALAPTVSEEPLQPTPEAAACAQQLAALLPLLAPLAALSSNLARLHSEYRRTVRRVRALQDVLLPEVERTLAEIETSLEELEQDEAVTQRGAATQRLQAA